ncbi:MAG: hypothetical protein EOP06_13095 [Proteobacteria bacterium]|nr:MAG: hypothetical protein EOP06_13095 [Pseudomonadota bacterium]
MKLKNYFQIGIGAGLLIALVGSIVWIKGGYSHADAATGATEMADGDNAPPDARLDEDIEAQMDPAPAPTVEARKKSEPVNLAKASEFFTQALQQMSACVNVNTGNPTQPVEPTFENLAGAVRNDLGEPILRSEDWTVWNLRVAGGEERRIRIETDYSDSDQTSRHLLYFKLDAQGNPTMIPLPPESTRDPSEAFVASLQKDGEMYEEEKGERAYFDGGQEMVLTQKNGHIDDVEFANGAKTYRCAGILTTEPNCKCL